MKIVVVLLSFIFAFLVVGPLEAVAQEMDTPEDNFSETTTEVSSFELFRPVVAGRTMDDSLYFLKSLKEKIRGFFIFGREQKADYAVFLAVKRVLEAEKLVNEGKDDLAKKTLGKALVELASAEKNIDGVPAQKGTLGPSGENMVNRLDNIRKLVAWLSVRNKEYKDDLQKVLGRSEILREKASIGN